MKTVFGLQLSVSKEEGDDNFTAGEINAFVLEAIKDKLSEKKLNIDNYLHKIGCFDKPKYEEYQKDITKYYEQVYDKSTDFTNSYDDVKYGNIAQFVFADQLRKDEVSNEIFLKKDSENASVFIIFQSNDKKIQESVRLIGDDIYAEYFKYDLND